MSGYGGGVEDLNVRVGKLAVAYLSGARPDIITENGYLAKNNVDVRLYDLKGPAGLWAGWFDYAISKGGKTSDGIVRLITRMVADPFFARPFPHAENELESGEYQFTLSAEYKPNAGASR